MPQDHMDLLELKSITKIIHSKRKTLAIQIMPNGELIARAPNKYPHSEIENFIYLRRKWVESKLKILKEKVIPVRKYVEGEEFLFLGEIFKLAFVDQKAISEDKNNKKLHVPNKFAKKDELQMALSKWYFDKAKEILNFRTNLLAEKFKVSLNNIKISKATTRWGSCSAKHNINLSYRLIMAPMFVIDYVIIHELAHTFHHNHSNKFWKKVEEMMPEYKEAEKWLKDNTQRMSV